MKRKLTNRDLHLLQNLKFSRLNITMRFTALILLVIFCAHVIMFCLLNIMPIDELLLSENQIIFITALATLISCIMMGLLFSNIFYRLIFEPLQNLLSAIREVGRGNFQVRLNSKIGRAHV